MRLTSSSNAEIYLLITAYSHLKPGAWFELAELGSVLYCDDGTMPDDWVPNRAWILMKEGLEKLGRIVPTANWMEKLLLDAGFVDVEVRSLCLALQYARSRNRQISRF